MLDAVVDYLPSPLDVPPMIAPRPAHRRRGHPDARRQRAVQRARLQDRGRPVRRQARVLPGLLGHAQGRLVRPQPDEGQEGADRPHPPDARQPPRGDRRGLRRRHRRGRRPQGHLHRRHAVRPRPPGRPRVDDVPGAGHRGQDRAEDEGRPGQAGDRPPAARRGGPDLPRPHRPGVGRDADRRHGRAAPRRARRPDGPRVQGRGEHRQAPGLLPRDDPPRRRGQRPLRPPDRRQGPVRPRRHHARAAGEGRRLRVRRQDRRRHDPARVHQVGRRRHPRGARDGHLRGLPGRRRQGDALRRLVPRGRLVRDGVQDRRFDGGQGRRSRRPIRRSSSRSCGSR